MRIFVAGATGALGLPLVRARFAEPGGGRDDALCCKRRLLEQAGAMAAFADGLDAQALEQAIRSAAPIASFT